jgi:TolB protein
MASRTRWKLLLLALLILVAAAAIVASTSGSDEGDEPPAPPASEVPLQTSAYSDIYVADVADRSLDRLTRYRDKFAREPSWSAAGGIAFSEAPPSDFAKLVIVDPAQRRTREVRTRITHLFHPTWSPDGKKLAAVRLGKGIYVVNPRTGAARRLPETGPSDGAPVWSPDGRAIIFERHLGGTNWDLYQVDPAGGLERVTRDPRQQVNATWSPDGSSVVFTEQQKTGNWALVRMRIDGSERKLLTDPRVSTQEPAWSPDGRQIALVMQKGERASIAVMDATGGDPVEITPRTLIASHPVWSPDGKGIAFSAQRAVRPPPSAPPGAAGPG